MRKGYIVRGPTNPKLALRYDNTVNVEVDANQRAMQQRAAEDVGGKLSLSANEVLLGLRGAVMQPRIPEPTSPQQAKKNADAAAWGEFTATMG